MVINENGLITEKQETQAKSQILNANRNTFDEVVKKSDFDLNSNNELDNEINSENEISVSNDTSADTTIMHTNANSSEEPSTEKEEIFSATSDIEKETAETNCLALTVRKDYNISIIKNGFFTTLRLSWKVAISTFVLNILKLFF